MVASQHGPMDPLMRLVLLVVNFHMHKDGKGGYPCQRCIAEETGLSERTVRGRLKLAIEQNWLLRSHRGKNGRGWNLYTYTAIIPARLAQFVPEWTKAPGDDRHAVPGDARRPAGADPRPAHSATMTGTSGHHDRHTVPTNSSSENLNNTYECPLARTPELLSDSWKIEEIRKWLSRPGIPEHHRDPETAIRVLPEQLRFLGYEQIVWQILQKQEVCGSVG